ncbi:sarcosine oxidase subunit gamma family protein [soil metagenome]
MTVDSDPRSPLAHRSADLAGMADNTGGSIVVAEVAFLAQVDLRVDPGQVRRVAFELPMRPNTATHDGDRTVLWLGPDEWLVVGPPWTGGEIVAELEAALTGVHHSVVDVSANRAVLELRGSTRHELLSKGCSLDLREDHWGPGTGAQTLLGGIAVILEERAEATRIFVRPSFGNHLTEWFLDATVEYRLL